MTSLSQAEKSYALTQAPSPASAGLPPDVSFEPSAIRDAARLISREEIPLPPNLDTAAGLDWARQGGFGGGPVSKTEIQQLLQVNAARDWVWFAVHNDLTAAQRAVVSDIPRWPALRGTPLGKWFGDAIARILAGTDVDWARTFASSLFRERGGEPPTGSTWETPSK